jgi:hypothetical protein
MTDVTTKTYDWAAEVKEVEGDDFIVLPDVYTFSNGRTFVEQPNSGIYAEDMQPE